MGLNIFKPVLRVSVLASIAMTMTMAIGCGDGKTKKRQPVNKNAKAGQQGRIDPKTGKPAVPPAANETDADRKKKAEQARAKGADESQLDGLITGYLDGQLMDKNQLELGTYKVSQVTTFLKYMPNNADHMRGFRTDNLRLDSANIPVLTQESAKGLGSSENNPDENGRVIELPASFEVNAQPFKFERSDAKGGYILLHTKVTSLMSPKGDFKVEMTNTATGMTGEHSKNKASVATLLAKDGIEDKARSDVKYSEVDGSKQIDLRLKKVSETKVRIIFEIMELKDTMVRTVVLDYDFTKAGGAPEREQGPPPPERSAQTSAGAEEQGAGANNASGNGPDDDRK